MKLHTRRVLNAIIVLLLIGFVWNNHSPSPPSSPSAHVSKNVLGSSSLSPVSKVIDGDTIEVLLDGKKEKVRLIGIDTPEVMDPRKPVQCFGKAASEKMKSLVTGQLVSLESDSTQSNRDVYGRLLRYVFLEDGTNVNLLLIQEGYAHEYTYKQNPYKYQSEFRNAEKEAREKGLGLWKEEGC